MFVVPIYLEISRQNEVHAIVIMINAALVGPHYIIRLKTQLKSSNGLRIVESSSCHLHTPYNIGHIKNIESFRFSICNRFELIYLDQLIKRKQ